MTTTRSARPLSTVTTSDELRPPTIGVDPIAAFWVPAVGVDVPVPFDLRAEVGRSPDCAVVINHPGVSRVHVQIERQGNRLRVVNRSKNGTEYRGVLNSDFVIEAGERMKFDQVEVFPLTRSMVAARRELAFCLGYGPEGRVMDLIAAAAAASSFAVVGGPGTPRYEVASALVRASPRRDARRRDVIRDQVPSDADAIRETASRTMGGVVYVDGDVLGKLDAAHRGALVQQVSDPKWNLMTLWGQELASVEDGKPDNRKAKQPLTAGPKLPTEVAMLCARLPSIRIVEIRSVASRARDELPTMLEHLFAAMGVGVTTHHLDRDPQRPNLRALQRYAWPDNHHELRLCAGYIAHALQGAGVEKIADMLGVTHDGKPLTRMRLRVLVEKWGLAVGRAQ